MSKFTEEAIMDALEEMLTEKPFEKIRVGDVIKKCGVSRNTFYYHNNDLYDLLRKTLKRQQERVLVDVDEETFNWNEGFANATKWLHNNKETVNNIYKSRNYDVLEGHIHDSIRNFVEEFVNDQAEGLNADETVIEDTIIVISAAIEGIVLNWIRTGMDDDLGAFVERVTTTLQGSTRKILKQSTK